jgi:hypothetical protein
MAGEFDEGYPRSSEADLDPGPDLGESLDEADREAGNEQRHVPEGSRPDESIEDEDRFEGYGDADEAAAAEPPPERISRGGPTTLIERDRREPSSLG